ncbi:penicillin-binding protein 1A [Oxalobacteraceae bacterium R-40]|uniref:Penicillin-binding protein 1A n=1 Tax=Keguizhuia sedimenti TaxID=3064264 RepID=A0ABU1BJZ9_9BURK|nr:penicillin-binding protein 1A [Oxalobacteraceae bacterium R-40]
MRRKRKPSSYFKKWFGLPLKQRLFQAGIATVAAGALAALLMAAYVFLFLVPTLPEINALTEYRPKIPLRIYTSDHVLIGEFGEERRDFVPIADMPPVMKNAIIAIEDSDFYLHDGVDFGGLVRAALVNLRNSRSQGASTITMQVARNFLLTRQKTYTRKIQEILLARKIEEQLSKDKILELYMNQIYLGERAYGFGTAARVYFGKAIHDVTTAEAAMLAGLPKAPATANPIVNPKRATERQQYILKRMRDLGYITPAEYARAAQEKLKIKREANRFGTHAEYAAEWVRQQLYAQFKDEIYTSGLTVYTTLRQKDQDAAYEAVRRGVLDYERRHGYRGPEANITLPSDKESRQQAIDEALIKYPNSGNLKSAVVTAASTKSVRAEMLSGEPIQITGEGLRFAAGALSPKASSRKRIKPGAVIRVIQDAKKRWAITQLPEVGAAFVAMDAQDGAIRAMVGGFDFALNKFDHVTQAWRQPGSTIKPFIYSAALEKGFWPGSMIEDEPLTGVIGENGREWNPGNDDGQYQGPVTMRTGLKRSRNLVSIRLLRDITPPYARDYLTRFGFDAERHPANLTMTLGTGSTTPLQMAGAYAVFANGGYQVAPYLIRKIVNGRGEVLSEAQPQQAGDENLRVLDTRNAFIMDSMLRDVTHSGTGYLAGQRLNRRDIAGKTGTTNDTVDGWFAGYGGNIVAVTWMGYDTPKSLGGREFGSTLALPIWVDYMRTALRGQPDSLPAMPNGIVQLNDDFLYQEYVASAEQSMDRGSIGGFLDRLFGTPAAPNRENEMELRRQQEMYGG